MDNMISAPSYQFDIYIAGDYATALNSLQEYVVVGECVSVQHCDYVFTYGREAGVKVTLIHYPRFPRTVSQLYIVANQIATKLLTDLHQGSYTIVGPDKTYFYDRREN